MNIQIRLRRYSHQVSLWLSVLFTALLQLCFQREAGAQLGASWSNNFQPRAEGLAEAYGLVSAKARINTKIPKHQKFEEEATKWLKEISKCTRILSYKGAHNMAYFNDGMSTIDILHFIKLDKDKEVTELSFINFSTTLESPQRAEELDESKINDMFSITIAENSPTSSERLFLVDMQVCDSDLDIIAFNFSPWNAERSAKSKPRGVMNGKLFVQYVEDHLQINGEPEEFWGLFIGQLKHLAGCLQGAITCLRRQEYDEWLNRITTIYIEPRKKTPKETKRPAAPAEKKTERTRNIPLDIRRIASMLWSGFGEKTPIPPQSIAFGTKVAAWPTVAFASGIGIAYLCRNRKKRIQ